MGRATLVNLSDVSVVEEVPILMDENLKDLQFGNILRESLEKLLSRKEMTVTDKMDAMCSLRTVIFAFSNSFLINSAIGPDEEGCRTFSKLLDLSLQDNLEN